MKKLAILVSTAGLAVGLAACDSEAENTVEETATAIDESYEAEAALVESMEEGGPEEEAAEERAEVLRETGEEIKDDLEESADQMDATPQ